MSAEPAYSYYNLPVDERGVAIMNCLVACMHCGKAVRAYNLSKHCRSKKCADVRGKDYTEYNNMYKSSWCAQRVNCQYCGKELNQGYLKRHHQTKKCKEAQARTIL